MLIAPHHSSTKSERGFSLFGCVPTAFMLLFAIMLSLRQKTKINKDTGVHAKDTGSPEVQVALLSKRIEELTSHLKKHKKDNHSRRGLLGMVADRQTHLNYLKKNYPRRYSSLIKKLELKK